MSERKEISRRTEPLFYGVRSYETRQVMGTAVTRIFDNHDVVVEILMKEEFKHLVDEGEFHISYWLKPGFPAMSEDLTIDEDKVVLGED